MNKMFGSHYVLSTLPIWAIAAILFTVTQLTILVGRDVLEGIPYQVSYSAMIGDAGFVVIVLIVAGIFKRYGSSVRLWPYRRVEHDAIFSLCVTFGGVISAMTLDARSGRAMDIYHDIIIAPLFMYLAVTLLPTVFMDGTKLEKRATICLILLWAGLVGFDVGYKRMNQRQWLGSHGVVLKQ